MPDERLEEMLSALRAHRGALGITPQGEWTRELTEEDLTVTVRFTELTDGDPREAALDFPRGVWERGLMAMQDIMMAVGGE